MDIKKEIIKAIPGALAFGFGLWIVLIELLIIF